jgi:NitT/TauT family transport system substrate-binding protein
MDKKLAIVLTIVVAVAVVSGALAATMLLNKDSATGTVYYLPMAPKDMRAALGTGQVDAYIAWEPYVSDSVGGHVGDVLMWSGDIMPHHPCCVVVVSEDFLAQSNGPEMAERFLKAHIEANLWMADALANPESEDYNLLVTLATEFTLRNESVVTAAFEHLQYGYEMTTEFRSALEQFTDMYVESNLTTNATLTSRGYSSVSDFIGTYVDGSYLETAASVQPSETILNPDDPIQLGFLMGDLHQLAQKVASDARVLGGTQSLFETYGLNVENATGAPFAAGGDEMAAFALGNVDIGYLGAPPAILSHLNAGTAVKIIAQANTEGSGIVVATGSDIRSLADLVNKTVAVPSVSSIQFLLLKTVLKAEGLDLAVKTA